MAAAAAAAVPRVGGGGARTADQCDCGAGEHVGGEGADGEGLVETVEEAEAPAAPHAKRGEEQREERLGRRLGGARAHSDLDLRRPRSARIEATQLSDPPAHASSKACILKGMHHEPRRERS
eukprot:3974200-Prymnesium_polylepis.1